MNGAAVWAIGASACALVGCSAPDREPPQVVDVRLAPAQSAVARVADKSAGPIRLTIDPARSHVRFHMDAPMEKIRGELDHAASGHLSIDPGDLSSASGAIVVDLEKLELFRRPRDPGAELDSFGQEESSPVQNRHAREWLEIGPAVPESDRRSNAEAALTLLHVERISESSLAKFPVGTAHLEATVQGDFGLRRHLVRKQIQLRLGFELSDGQIVSLHIQTEKPMPVGLLEHDVVPRDALGKLASKGLAQLAAKVAPEAMVDVDLIAVPGR